ncbi:MAG: FHA domain-containing protein [Deltaproteobacteria bacterium]|nr:FHA domain-containing protein [Deltaproteobacteria bacterium]
MRRFRIIYQSSNLEAQNGTFDIGRSIDCNLVLDDPSVSRVHATIIKDDDSIILKDLKSRNGCKVNGNTINGQIDLKDGDIITIGHQDIKISEIKQSTTISASVKNTMGLIACKFCGNWMSMGDEYCPSCKKSISDSPNEPSKSTQYPAAAPRDNTKDTQLPVIQSSQMIAGLARKALSKNKPSEAAKLTKTLMETAIKKVQSNTIAETDLNEIVALTIEISVQNLDTSLISELFDFFTRIQKIIPRESVELLYKSIRKTGYRSCPKMHRYLTVLGELSRKFTPGEKFVHRRIEGLLGLTS